MAEETNTKKQRGNKKKATNSFRTYIHKVLRQVHPDSQISSNTREQLDEFIKILARELAGSARQTCADSKKSTVGLDEIKLAINFHLPGILAKHAVSEVDKAVARFSSNSAKEEEKDSKRSTPVRRETQAGLVFAVSLCEKFIRNFRKKHDLNVSKNASIALAATLEYITAEILELAGNTARDNKKVIINMRHVYLAVYNDSELTFLVDGLGIEFLGGGVLPNIRAEFLPNKEKRQEQAARRRKNAKKNSKTDDPEGASKKHHKYRPGTKALMEIRKYQKTTDLLLRKLPFSRAVRKIAEELNAGNDTLNLKDIHFGAGTIEVLQGFIESRVATLCKNAVDMALHAKRDGVNSDDIKVAWKLTEPLILYTETQVEEIGDNGLERLTYQGGIKRKGNGIYSAFRCYVYSLLNAVILKALQNVTYRKVITLGIQDLRKSFTFLRFHVTIPSTMGKPKHTKKASSPEAEDLEENPVEEIEVK